jgi:hypothetical protein
LERLEQSIVLLDGADGDAQCLSESRVAASIPDEKV